MNMLKSEDKRHGPDWENKQTNKQNKQTNIQTKTQDCLKVPYLIIALNCVIFHDTYLFFFEILSNNVSSNLYNFLFFFK